MNKNQIKMSVLSVSDIQKLNNISYSSALYELKKYNYFYINSRPYILASEYIGQKYRVAEITYNSIEEGDNTKMIKVLPLMLTVKDIQSVFQCGTRQAYEIMDLIPCVFKVNSKRYVREKDFAEWLETLPNSQLKIA